MCFPHPVDGIGHGFKESVGLEDFKLGINLDDSENLVFYIQLITKGKYVKELIKRQEVEFLAEFDCEYTFFRMSKSSIEREFTFVIPRKSVYHELTFSCSIVVKDKLDYQDPYGEWSDDFKEVESFQLKKGDPIVIYPERVFPLDLKFEKLYAAGSFIQVDKTDKPSSWIDINDEKIVIMLPNKTYKMFEELHRDRQFATIFQASFIMNALAEALMHIHEDIYKNKLWARAICQRVNTEKNLKEYREVIEEQGSKQRVYELAQAILDDPYSRLLLSLKDIQNSQTNNRR